MSKTCINPIVHGCDRGAGSRVKNTKILILKYVILPTHYTELNTFYRIEKSFFVEISRFEVLEI